MTIEEYKKQLTSIVEEMEEEHGCDITRLVITVGIRSEFNGVKTFKVNIEM